MAFSQTQKDGQLRLTETVSPNPSSGGHGFQIQIQPPEPDDRRWPPAYSHQNPLLEAEDDDNTSSTQCCATYRVREQPKAQLEEYFEIKPHIPVDFDNVFQEPEDAGGLEVAYIINKAVYHWTKRCVYIVFSSLLGPILAFLFGIIFALLQFINVWLFNPVVRLVHVFTRWLGLINRPIMRTVYDPFFEAVSQALKQRNAGKFTERSYKLNVTGVTLGENAGCHHETA